MAITWSDKNKDLQIKERETAAYQAGKEAGANEVMMITKAHPPGELPPYVPPDKPSSPWEPGKSPAPSRKMAGLRINPNSILLPFVPKDPETDEDWGEGDVTGHPDWKMAHKGQHYNEHGQPISDPAQGFRPDGSPVYMEHMEQTPEEHEYYKKLYEWKFEGGEEPKNPLMISQSPAALDALRKGKAPGLSSKQIRGLIKPFTKPDQFGHPTGSLRV